MGGFTAFACSIRLKPSITDYRHIVVDFKSIQNISCPKYPIKGIYFFIFDFSIFVDGGEVKLNSTEERDDHFLNIIEEISAVADKLPCVILIHKLPDLNLLYMSNLGLKLLGREWHEVKDLSYDEFIQNFFNEEDAKVFTPKLLELLEGNVEFAPYFQQVRTGEAGEFAWYMTVTKVLQYDEDGRPLLLITSSMQVDPEHYFTGKAARLLEENEFLKNHYNEFAKLTVREQEVLKLLALGKSAMEIGEELHISAATAETHRKKVYQKLNTNNSYVLGQYARAFNLI